MQRRKFSREFKVEAVKLVRERGVSVAQGGRDLGVHGNVLRKWVKEFGSDPVQAFPGHGQMKPEQQETAIAIQPNIGNQPRAVRSTPINFLPPKPASSWKCFCSRSWAPTTVVS